MPSTADGGERLTRRAVLAVGTATTAGFALTLVVFYPGIWTFDARYIYEYIARNFYGDWQSPVMTLLWGWIDPVAPGAGSMFLLIAACYWLAFGLVGLALARQSAWCGVVAVALALTPPAFVFVGVIWRDVFFAAVWLLAAALVFAANGKLRLPAQIVALALLAFGVLLRPNALLAAPLLAAYLIWPSRFSWKRAVIIYLPVAALLYGSVQLIYYGALNSKREFPLHSLMVFDLGGISHFTKQNQFPVTWDAPEAAMLLDECYKPTEWDIYWRHEPCLFVMKRLERENLFGSSTLTNAWLRAVTHHPVAYLRHRAAFMTNFLTGSNLTMWVFNIDDPDKPVLNGRPVFLAVEAIHDALKPTPLFRMGAWLLVCLALCGLAWRRRETPPGAFVIGICGTASIYVTSLFVVGVASDFRYGYLAVPAALAGLAAFMCRPAETAPASTA